MKDLQLTIEMIVALVTLLGVLWRVADGVMIKKEYRKDRKSDEDLRIERQANLDIRLTEMTNITTDTNDKVRIINGVVQRHDQWIADHEKIHHSRKR